MLTTLRNSADKPLRVSVRHCFEIWTPRNPHGKAGNEERRRKMNTIRCLVEILQFFEKQT